jgi:hypothetical protein
VAEDEKTQNIVAKDEPLMMDGPQNRTPAGKLPKPVELGQVRLFFRWLGRRLTFGKLGGMAKPEGYVPKPGDSVLLEGVSIRLMVVRVDTVKETATLSSPSTPIGTHTVSWSELFPALN